jgi:hypothetical protein
MSLRDGRTRRIVAGGVVDMVSGPITVYRPLHILNRVTNTGPPFKNTYTRSGSLLRQGTNNAKLNLPKSAEHYQITVHI